MAEAQLAFDSLKPQPLEFVQCPLESCDILFFMLVISQTGRQGGLEVVI